METNYKWNISAMDCKIKEGTLENIVNFVHWRLNAFNDIYNIETYGIANMPEPSSTNFTPYEDLTKEQVVQWLNNVLDVEKIKINLNKNLFLQEYPIEVSFPLPFENE